MIWSGIWFFNVLYAYMQIFCKRIYFGKMVKSFFVVVEFEVWFCYFPKKYFLIFSIFFRLKMKWTEDHF